MNSRMILAMCVFLAGPALAQEVERDTTAFAEIIFGRGAKARQTLRIVDDDGNFVTGAKVQMSFVMPGCQWIHGQSDSNGLFTAEGQSGGEVNYHIEKDGYYPSSDTLNIGNKDGVVIKDGLWQPWNPEIRVVLHRIINPIPMYAKRVGTFIPVREQPVGYDLMVGDWVDPYGKGIRQDFVFTIVERRVASWSDYDGEILLTFPSSHDGVQLRGEDTLGGSSFPWKHNASDSGFQSRWRMRVGYTPGKGYYEDNDSGSAYFRIRSQTNSNGDVVSALYGKIPAPFEVDVRENETGWVRFTYYLNPTPNDRNMEFDPKRNLFKNLKSTEEVTAP